MLPKMVETKQKERTMENFWNLIAAGVVLSILVTIAQKIFALGLVRLTLISFILGLTYTLVVSFLQKEAAFFVGSIAGILGAIALFIWVERTKPVAKKEGSKPDKPNTN